ncbi:hypothetical protein FRC01_008555, partial [Tulasnella sp. 417]
MLSDLRQSVEFFEDNDMLKDRDVMRSTLGGNNLMFDHFERVIVGPICHSSSPIVGKDGYQAEQESQPLELIVEAARSADNSRPQFCLYCSITEEFLEEFDPLDPYEVEEFATAVDVEDISIGLRQVSAVAAEKQISNWEEDSGDTDSATFSRKSGPDRRFTNDRKPAALRSARRKRQEQQKDFALSIYYSPNLDPLYLYRIVFHLLFIGFGDGDAVRAVPVLKEWLPPKSSAVTVVQDACPGSLDPIRTHSTALPTPTHQPPTSAGSSTTSSKGNEHATTVEPEESSDNTASIEELRKMVSQTQGFFGRDFSLGLGWNNMRYIIEAAILQAQLTNRTLVLPSFVYARSCEWEIDSCAAFATMVNRGDAIGWGEWRGLPIEKQMGWRIPMDTMLDLPHLRKTWSVILVREYLEMHGMDPNKEWSNGAWHRTDYLAEKADGSKYTLYNIKNNLYDPKNVVRVDTREPFIQRGIKEDADTGSVGRKLYSAMNSKNSKNVIDLDDARNAVGDLMKDRRDDQELQRLLEENGWVVLHTFAAALSIDYHKSVVQPTKQVAPLRWVKGWQDDYKNTDTDILLLEGETHLGRKPGGMRFSTEAARDDFARTVLYGMRPIDK